MEVSTVTPNMALKCTFHRSNSLVISRGMLLQINHGCELCNVSNQDDPGPPKEDVLTLDSLWLHLFHQLSHCLVATSKPTAAVHSGTLNSASVTTAAASKCPKAMTLAVAAPTTVLAGESILPAAGAVSWKQSFDQEFLKDN